LEVYPHPDRFKRIIDELAYVIGIITPLMSIPQIWSIWVDHSVVGVSLLSWSAFTVASCFWVVYSFLHHELPIIISQVLWVLFQIAIVAGILMYR